jgi:erythronate-4-phosphate dehydrogenase
VKIVADENIPLVKDGFGRFGEVRVVPGRAITAEAVRDAELLIVRSVTKVNGALLDGSAVRFVGTCTIGTDHLDIEYLKRRGIAIASAPGSNATSVAEYIAAVMLQLAKRQGFRLAEKTIGVVGVGNVGSRVAGRAEALGMKVMLGDPPLARETHDAKYRALDEVLDGADIVTLHVPLEKGGADPTWHMVDEGFLAKMRPGAVLFNSSRGAVHDTRAVLAARRSGRLGALFLDVWENEPEVDVELVAAADVASPHICGYSADGKLAGVVIVHRAAAKFLGVKSEWDPSGQLPAPIVPEVTLTDCTEPAEDLARRLVLGTYDFADDDRRMREMIKLPAAKRGKHFDALRRDYPCRREFHNTKITLTGECRRLSSTLAGLGFSVVENESEEVG